MIVNRYVYQWWDLQRRKLVLSLITNQLPSPISCVSSFTKSYEYSLHIVSSINFRTILRYWKFICEIVYNQSARAMNICTCVQRYSSFVSWIFASSAQPECNYELYRHLNSIYSILYFTLSQPINRMIYVLELW